MTGSSPVFRTITVYSAESPGFTVCEFGLTLKLMLAAAETGVAIIGSSDTTIKLTKKNAVRLEREMVCPRLTMIGGERLSIKSLSFHVWKKMN